ncbi:hypothetical protein IHE44_0005067 [Lamprotornis superbus]|uniref:AP complex mu/sigma subunit domain-containing protein n=1 Tax=Lamprotornis superbus TaxID=245042 RepID=A0A835P1D0_9PASS|nr:hypothetical protein IHE44_0005067 [Lamprotornis superbus]
MLGKLRLQKWYVPLSDKEKKKITRELVQTVLARKPKMCSFLEWRDLKIVYKRPVWHREPMKLLKMSLYQADEQLNFVLTETSPEGLSIRDQDNELITLEIIHRYVELLDKYFGSVCELDIIFNFEKAYFILDEFLLGGEVQETSKKNVLKAIEQADLLQEMATKTNSGTYKLRLRKCCVIPNLLAYNVVGDVRCHLAQCLSLVEANHGRLMQRQVIDRAGAQFFVGAKDREVSLQTIRVPYTFAATSSLQVSEDTEVPKLKPEDKPRMVWARAAPSPGPAVIVVTMARSVSPLRVFRQLMSPFRRNTLVLTLGKTVSTYDWYWTYTFPRRKSLSIPGFQLDPASSAQLPINGANTGLVKTLRTRKTSVFDIITNTMKSPSAPETWSLDKIQEKNLGISYSTISDCSYPHHLHTGVCQGDTTVLVPAAVPARTDWCLHLSDPASLAASHLESLPEMDRISQ